MLDHVGRQPYVGLGADPGVQVDHQHGQARKKAQAAPARPAAAAPVAPTPYGGRRQIQKCGRGDQQRERHADRAVDVPVKRERAQAHPLLEDLSRAVPTGEVDLVRSRSVCLLVEVDEEIGVQGIRAVALALELG